MGWETRTCDTCSGSGRVYCGRDRKGNSVWTTCGTCKGRGTHHYPTGFIRRSFAISLFRPIGSQARDSAPGAGEDREERCVPRASGTRSQPAFAHLLGKSHGRTPAGRFDRVQQVQHVERHGVTDTGAAGGLPECGFEFVSIGHLPSPSAMSRVPATYGNAGSGASMPPRPLPPPPARYGRPAPATNS